MHERFFGNCGIEQFKDQQQQQQGLRKNGTHLLGTVHVKVIMCHYVA